MKRTILFPLIAVLVIATAAFAQQYGRGSGSGTPPSGTPTVVTGTVVTFTSAAGAGMPSLVVDQNGAPVTFVLGPFWFLQNAKFSATAGDRVELTVLSCASCPNGNAVVAVKNLTNGSSATLRNSDGVPLWQSKGSQRGPGGGMNGQQGQYGAGSRGGSCNGTAPDMTQLTSFSGKVASFTGGARAGRPTLVLVTAQGERTFLVAPYRIVMDAGYEFVAGASITLTAVPNANGEWVVVSLHDDATGADLVLRDAQTGLPVGGGGRGHC